MNKKFVGFTILFVGLFVFVLSAAQVGSVMASPELQPAIQGCGGGNYKLDNLPDSWTEASMSWASTPGFDCLYGVAGVSFEFKAGHYTGGPNECYGASWDQNGWSVWEKWTGESSTCQNTSHVTIFWTCECPPPPTDTPVPPTETPVIPPTETPVIPPTETPVIPPTETPVIPPTETPVIPPTETPVIPPTETPVIPPTETPECPTATPTEPPPPTATPKPPDKPTGPGDTNALLWIVLLALGAGISVYGARKIVVE